VHTRLLAEEEVAHALVLAELGERLVVGRVRRAQHLM
jgi:hypothetical protein